MDDRTAAREHLEKFREQFRNDAPGWYRGELHLAFILLLMGSPIAFCLSRVESASTWEWLFVIPVLLFGNWVEWAVHRYIFHRPTKWLKGLYKRHLSIHHQFYTHHNMSFEGQQDWRGLLFPPLAPITFVLLSVPPALFIAALWSANAGYITVSTMAAYYLMYEGLHTLSHIENSWLLDRIPLLNTIRRMHAVHHNREIMHARNFNFTFPICDALFGTSDLDRGLIGTLFNGMSNTHVRKDDERVARREPPPPLSENLKQETHSQ